MVGNTLKLIFWRNVTSISLCTDGGFLLFIIAVKK